MELEQVGESSSSQLHQLFTVSLRWIGVRSGMVAGIFSATLAVYLTYGSGGINSSSTGFSLAAAGKNANQSKYTCRADIHLVGLSSLILSIVRQVNRVGVEGNRYLNCFRHSIGLQTDIVGSIERVEQYLNIEQEPKPTAAGAPPAYWPASGDLRVEGLSARYSAVRI